jgi:hypothetical protein
LTEKLRKKTKKFILQQKELWNFEREIQKQKSDTQIERKMRQQLCERA